MKPTKEERKLFRQAIKGVIPLKKSEYPSNSHKQQPPVKPDCQSQGNYKPREISDGHIGDISIEETVAFFPHHFNRKKKLAFVSGKLAIEAKLDLHYLHRESAHIKLDKFINHCSEQGKRCLLIIHGKGAGIIKNLCVNWLKQYPEILAFHSAIPRHGGTGALYVYLRRP
jgi:DNA-nicking Smr family endonuclease